MANLKHTKTAAKIRSGIIGDLKWDFSDGVLTISGDGEIPDYDDYRTFVGKGIYTDEARSPWYSFRKNIKKIVLNGNITQKSVYTFLDCKNLKSILFENASEMIDILNRTTHGYSLIDIWNIDSWFFKLMPRMLQEFRQNSYGCVPGRMKLKEWDSILERMIFCFTEMGDLIKNQYLVEGKTKEESDAYRELMKDEGFALFSKYFWCLWW